ncbi:unnamed protein product [Brassica oleracea]
MSLSSSHEQPQVITCKAAVTWRAGEPLVMEEVEVSPPQPLEIRIKVVCTSLCRSDLSAWESQSLLPRIFGHEAAGIVESIGEGVTEFEKGDHVLAVFTGECGSCRHCISGKSNMCQVLGMERRGLMHSDQKTRFSIKGKPVYHYCAVSSFSEYTVVHSGCAVKVHPLAPLHKICLLSCGAAAGSLGAAWNVADVQRGSSVVIFGLGTVGLSVAQGAKLRGAAQIIGVDINSSKAEQAKIFGVTDFINSNDISEPIHQVIKRMTGGGADFSFECVGDTGVATTALQSCSDGWGMTVTLGVPKVKPEVSAHYGLFLSGKSLKGSLFGGWKPKSDLPSLIEKYMNKEIMIDELVTHDLAFDDINEAFELMREGKCLRCVLHMSKWCIEFSWYVKQQVIVCYKDSVLIWFAIAAALARDQPNYSVFLISHLAHQNLSSHLFKANVSYVPITSPPAQSSEALGTQNDSARKLFLEEKEMIKREHRQECRSAFGRIFGEGPCMDGDLVVINFFALEGWSLAELYQIRCVVAAPYVVPYSPPSGFERMFRKELPELYKYLKEAPIGKVSWSEVTHWMWPLFTEEWGSWRSEELNLSCYPFADPVTDLPIWHIRPPSPLVLYGFSKEIVECPDYWPLSVRVCGFWFLPNEWQFSCNKCGDNPSAERLGTDDSHTCSNHTELYTFVSSLEPSLPIFVGLSSIGSMGFMKNPLAFLRILESVIQITGYRFIILTAGYEPLEVAICTIAQEPVKRSLQEGVSIFNGKLFCFSGMVPYNWLFRRCAAAIHHGGSGSTAAALHAGIPQIICPFMMDQFYWAEKMTWLGVAPQPLKRNHLLPEESNDESIMEAAQVVAKAVYDALSSKTRDSAMEIAELLSLEDGVSEVVTVLREEVCEVSGSNQT